MAKGSTRRAKVIKAMIAFVIVLALLTFFSNTLMNMTIPKVMGSYASRGNLSYSYSSKGNIKVENQTEVKGLNNREVESVNVWDYSEVVPGDVLFTLKSVEESAELEQKREDLHTYEKEIEYESRKGPQTTDYTMYYDNINSAKADLSDAKDTLDQVKNRASDIEENNKIIDEESVKSVSLQASVDAAAQTVEDLQKDIDGIDASIAPLKSQIDVYIALGTPTPTPTLAPTDPKYVAPDPSYVPNLDSDGLDKNSPTYEMDKLLFKINQLEEQKEALESQLDSAQARLDDASAALAECQGKITEAKGEIARLEGLPSEASAQSAVSKAQNAVNSAQKSLNDQRISDGITQDENKEKAEARDKKIEKLKKEIKELEDAAKITEIKAPVAGYVFNITVQKGSILSAKENVCVILPKEGRICSVEFRFATNEAQNIWQGMNLEVTSGYVENCTVTGIRPDPNNPRGTRLVKCYVDGECWPDEEITVNAGKGNDMYKCVVQSSAVSEDTNGYFVYTINGSSTPLGDKYTVKRVDVKILATDGAATAIEGEGLDKYDVMIVIRAEKPLEDGQRVRLEDYTAK